MHISLTDGPPHAAWLDDLPTGASGGALADVFQLAQRLARRFPTPGAGSTLELWECLASLASSDLGTARAIEPHLDACAILTQAGGTAPHGTWGVFAAGGGPAPLEAVPDGDAWVLTGEKPWCSLAAHLDGALVTALAPDGPRVFAVDLHAPGVSVISDVWHARGLTEIPSGPVRFTEVRATAVGAPRWYLERPGFWWGGIGVAACWYGGAVGIARAVFWRARHAGDPHGLAHLGAIDALLHGCKLALRHAAGAVDQEPEAAGRILARQVRALIARTCEEVLQRAGHALGPAPLATDAEHAKRVADLQLYIRQQHAERDDAAHGARLVESEAPPW